MWQHTAHIATTRRRVFGPACVSAAVGLLAAVIASSFTSAPTIAQLVGDRLTTLIPLPIFAALLGLFGTNAKHIFYIVLLLVEGALTALIGTLYWRWRPRLVTRLGAWVDAQRPSWVEAPVLALVLWFLAAGLLLPLVGGGILGAGLPGGSGAVFLAALVPNLVFALVFVARLRQPAPAVDASADSPDRSRRRLLGQGALAVAILAGGAVTWELIANVFGLAGNGNRYALDTANTPAQIAPPPQPTYGPWTPVSGQTAEITPVGQFYYVSKNLVSDPAISANDWQLQIAGMVERPFTLTYTELQALPFVEQYHTLECISNEVGGSLMSNALWRGVRLADLLQRAGLKPGASELVFEGADGYSDSLHLSQVLDPRTLVVYLIDGQPLPMAHGFPARLLVPGLYGMKNGKWLTSLQVGAGSYTGYWEQQGWSREARVKLTSRLDVPSDGAVLAARATWIAGVAYAGARGIARVDVTTDGGQTWQPATLRQPLGSLTWVLWEYTWTPGTGTYVLASRAIDLDGNVQSYKVESPLPYGATGYDAIEVAVR